MKRLYTRIYFHFVGVLVVVGLLTSAVFSLGQRGAFWREVTQRMSRHLSSVLGEGFADPALQRSMVQHMHEDFELDLTVHEAMPGHFLQLMHNNTFSSKVRAVFSSGAFVEGWALYAETLGYPMGLYADPRQHWGTLDDEMLRAMRLVVDTGIHAMKWSREQATDYMIKTTGFPHRRSQSEVERYCTMMGQACSYKIGHLAWARARAKAQAALGAKFDLKAFHEVLLEGAMPLSILEARIEARTAAALKA